MRFPRRRNIWIFIVAAIIVIFGGLIVWGLVTTTNMVALANEFSPPTGSTKIGEAITRPTPLCWGGRTCPSVFRSWESSETIDNSILADLVKNSGWALNQEGDCGPGQNIRTLGLICSASGLVDGFWITINVVAPITSQSRGTVSLDLNSMIP